ncbi:hypothetical protein Q0590_32855 [Rhodocytophaga aerolata]|uniref:Uncharacterized protein n=1 Tax=Rhodocytophaga aerolata TaxID=455078 RepID=A0ABT8RG93_9BACT|nr:hypothetical protein [Rhodocytophaga aerolata]MDO1451110.1 hypothetical protein [Rhodocytophaga aerolata]
MLRSDSLKRKAILAWKLHTGEAKQITAADLFGQKAPFSALEKTAKPKSCARNNRSHISMSDPEAKLSQKTGKPSRLYYLASMAVDTADVLCHPFIMSLPIYKQTE